MELIKSYIDSSVIIDAVSPIQSKRSDQALAILRSPARVFVSGDYVKLETLPKMRYFKRQKQIAFAEAFFKNAAYICSTPEIVLHAESLAEQYGLSAMDALHVASAISGGADELLTFEKPSKPFFRLLPDVLKVVSLHSSAS